MRVPYVSGKEGGEKHHCLQQFLVPRPALGHFAAGTSETLFLTYFRRLLGAINNQQRRPNAAWAETSPATSRSRGPRAAPDRGLGKSPQPTAEAAEPPPHLANHPVGLRKGSPSFPAGERGVRPTQTSPPPAMPAAPETGRPRRGARLRYPSRRGRTRSRRSARPPCTPSPLPGTDLGHKGAAAAARRSPVLPAESRPRQHRDGVAQASDASACCSRDGPCRRRPLCAGRGGRGGRWEPAESRFLLPGAEGRRVPELPPGGLRRRLSRGRC